MAEYNITYHTPPQVDSAVVTGSLTLASADAAVTMYVPLGFKPSRIEILVTVPESTIYPPMRITQIVGAGYLLQTGGADTDSAVWHAWSNVKSAIFGYPLTWPTTAAQQGSQGFYFSTTLGALYTQFVFTFYR